MVKKMQTKNTCVSLLFLTSLALACVGCVQDTDTDSTDSPTVDSDTAAPLRNTRFSRALRDPAGVDIGQAAKLTIAGHAQPRYRHVDRARP